jgi:PmbA protein
MNLDDQAAQLNRLALELGADEATVLLSRSVSTELGQRGGKMEKCQQARSFSAAFRLLVGGRYSAHSSSDARPEAMRGFLGRAIDATRHLEADPDRALPRLGEMGSEEHGLLDVDDPGWSERTPEDRKRAIEELEDAILSKASTAPLRSATAWLWDSRTESCMNCSNGYSAGWSRTSFGQGGELTLEGEGGRLPEAYDFYSSRHLEDLPAAEFVALSLVERGRRRLASKAVESGRLPMLLENRAAGRILGVLLQPMSGTAIYENRSCLKDKLGTAIAGGGLSIQDDPHIPRGLSSYPYDGDGRRTAPTTLLENGVLKSFFVDVYNSRRLGTEATTPGTSNLLILPGSQSPKELLKPLPRAIRVEGFLGGNSNGITGDFSFGITGTLFEHGEPVQAVSEMNISGNLFPMLESYQAAASDVWTYGSYRVPSLLFDGIQFSGI